MKMMPDGIGCVLTSSNDRGGVPSANERLPFFDEAAAAVLWERVKQIVVEELGVKPELVSKDAHIVYDLGAD